MSRPVRHGLLHEHDGDRRSAISITISVSTSPSPTSASNKLLRNNGNGTFTDIASGWGGSDLASDRATRGHLGVGLYDFNLDGWEDLYLPSGNVVQSRRLSPADELYVDDGTGTHSSTSALRAAQPPGDSKDIAFTDYDRDGAWTSSSSTGWDAGLYATSRRVAATTGSRSIRSARARTGIDAVPASCSRSGAGRR